MLDRLLDRIRQFISGLFANYSATDAAFVRNFLGSQELALFNQLPYFEKKHSEKSSNELYYF